VLVWVLSQDGPEEGGAGRQYQLVCLDLSGTTADGAVKEILLFSDLSEGYTDVALKIVPPKTKLFIGSHGNQFRAILGFMDRSWQEYS